MEIVQNNNGKRLKINALLLLSMLVVARVTCSALSNIPIFSVAFTFIYGAAFIALYLLANRNIKTSDFYLMCSAFVYALYVVFRSFIAGKSLFARDSFNAYIIIFLTVIYVWIKGQSLETKALMFKLIFTTLIFDYVYSIIVLIQDPNASRTAASLGVLEKSPYDILSAVGSFDTVYGSLSIIVILVCMRQLLKKRQLKDFTSLFVLILSFVFVIMASYATALLLLILTVALLWGQKNKTASAILLILLLLLLIFHDPVGEWIMRKSYTITYSETISEKAYDIGYMLKTFEASGTYAGDSGRASKMTASWETFLRHPIFGGIGLPDCKVYGHSEILDFLGNFGIIGFAFLVIYMVCLYRSVRKELPSKHFRAGWAIIILVFIISAVLNPSLYSMQMVPLILMAPLSFAYVEMCAKKKWLGEHK